MEPRAAPSSDVGEMLPPPPPPSEPVGAPSATVAAPDDDAAPATAAGGGGGGGGGAPPASPAGLDITPRPGESASDAKARAVDEALDCPCIDAMREGPCGAAFLTAYRCFLESESEPRGEECVTAFSAMHSCVVAHPEVYGEDEEEEEAAADAAGAGAAGATTGGGVAPAPVEGGGGGGGAPDVALASSVAEKGA